jgi:hypothetical protein
MRGVLSPRSFFTDQMKLEILLGRMPTVLIMCLDTMLCMRLKVISTKSKKAIEEESLGGLAL